MIRTAEHTALADSARRFVDTHYDPAVHRARLSKPQPFDRVRWQQMAEFGWLGTAIDDDAGGSGLDFSYLSVLAEALGPALMREPFASQTALAGHFLQRAAAGTARDALLERWLTGEMLAAVVECGPPDADGPVSQVAMNVIDCGVADVFLVVDEASPDAARIVASDAPGVSVTRHTTIDGRDLGNVEFMAEALAGDGIVEFRGGVRAALAEARALYALILCSESLGVARALVRTTCEYVHERQQFGAAIGSFQALQHRLVDMLLACTRMESLVELARGAADTAEFSLVGATIDRMVLGTIEGARRIGREAIQLHGAIAITDEYVVGHCVRRLTANEILLGGTGAVLERLADTTERARASSRH
jgi:alkylation response protein AidB-like acyl-CoA dehydrogenase